MTRRRYRRSLHRRITTWWGKAGVFARAGTALGMLVAAICAMALIMGAIRLAQWETRIGTAKTNQQLMQREYDFNPGEIISDAKFFNSDAMSAAEIQSFLNARGAACTGSHCLKSMTFDTASHKADDLCAAYRSVGRETAASIIDKSARACGISQKVLLVMLQKEQHLVSATDATDSQYQTALGLSCPDTAGCDQTYAGFFNQVYGAARRYQYYRHHGGEYAYHAATLSHVAYSPNGSCGGSDVYIVNEATVLLYIYTPYQPNIAALRANGGEGDSCSSYGNRNFSIIYSQWFGNTRG